ncbi:proline racemase family protein [Bailinhaonella thermotolerans]|uniref:Proline racemase n=1 Tax=Bailinhaonella thermotolerans TaxID=1070861 RepID=A0A3A4B309_9ACTN|nr:proline racemase family protein [Bailinhaonella thermotolerans]RJL36105.1 proline racemase [Bailinhaonella thermotolerans]
MSVPPGAGGVPVISTVDYHTGGEPFRIVVAGAPPIPGATVAERRLAARAPEIDVIRRLLCHEPRGHADMYGCFLVPPDDPGARFGAVFWHKDGYSTACGHGTIALGAWAVDTGLAAPGSEVPIDVPSGRVVAKVERDAVTFRSVPSYVLARGIGVRTAYGTAEADLSYGGAVYASVPAAALGLALRPGSLGALIAAGREVKAALSGHPAAEHPADPRLSGVYGVVFHEELGPGRQRNVTVFADGEVDRSPCGSGTAARLALLHEDGFRGTLTHESLVGSVFTARVAAETVSEGRPAVIPEVTGMAYRTGEHRFTLDPRDPLGPGFTLR